jgi:Fe-S oxidoreductase
MPDTASDLLLERLLDWGVDTVFGLPGDGINGFWDALRDDLRSGTPVVALEPSCGAVFRDELLNMLPHDEDAKRLGRLTCSLAELLTRRGWTPPELDRRALVHLHCHQKATSDTDCDLRLIEATGIDHRLLDSGCCGLAGSFGYEAGEKYEVAMKAGERVLLPECTPPGPTR